MASIPPAARLFYVGLWMLADDSGYFRWDVAQIGAELYSFEPRVRRERNVASWGDVLETAGRIERYPCGHAFIPTLTDHQRMSAATKRVKTFEREHERCAADGSGHPRTPADPRPVGNVSPTGTGRANRNDMESVAPARAPRGAADADDWTEKIAALQARQTQ